MAGLPTGTLTFLFTDIEGSTRLLERLGPRYADVRDTHNALVRGAFEPRGGHEVSTEGDSFFVVFERASDALAAAVEARRELSAHGWPDGVEVRARMGLHTGEVSMSPDGYVGMAIHEAARIAAAGHGGQIMISGITRDVIAGDLPNGVTLRDLGEHALKDIARPPRLFQVDEPGLPDQFPPLRTADAQPTNLPSDLTSFVGREQDITTVTQRLAEARMLTLTGAGGSGKTRLARRVAATLLEDHPDGVWLVEFAAIADPNVVPSAVAQAMGLRESTGQPIAATIEAYLRSRRALLLFDNCEHLLAACGELAASLLAAAPDVRILATSREALGVLGEATWPVPSLAVPADATGEPGDLARAGAIALFCERAALVDPAFRLDASNAAAIVDICARLDGIPLAIELAAARLQALSVEQIADRLSDRFRLLVGGSRAALERQQTLRATMDWSYDLLDDPERALLHRLSVFSGGFTLEAAEVVCAGDGLEAADVLDVLASLIRKSLVTTEPSPGQRRYGMLETVRAYAQSKLIEADEGVAVRDRHVAWCIELAARADLALSGAEQATWLARLDREHENLRAALSWIGGSDARAVHLAGSLATFWEIHGHFTEGRAWLDAALAEPGERTAERARALAGLARLRWVQARHAEVREPAQEALTIAREVGDRATEATALTLIATEAWVRDDQRTVRASLLEDALPIAREVGDPTLLSATLVQAGLWALGRACDYPLAATYLDEALTSAREAGGPRAIAIALQTRAWNSFMAGDLLDAKADLLEGHSVGEELQDRRYLIDSNLRLAWVAFHLGDVEEAMVYMDGWVAMREESGLEAPFGGMDSMKAWMLAMTGDPSVAAMVPEPPESDGTRGEMVANVTATSAWGRFLVGDVVAARRLIAKSTSIMRALEDKAGVASYLWQLGEMARVSTDYASARADLAGSIALASQIGAKLHGLDALDAIARYGVDTGDHARAVRLYAAAGSARAALHAPRLGLFEAADSDAMRSALDALGAGAYEDERRAGAVLDLSAAIELATTMVSAD